MKKTSIVTLIQGGKLIFLAAGVGILATGCQTYTQQGKDMTQNWRQGNLPEVVKETTAKADKNKDNKDTVIWRLEQGAALRASGQYRESIAAFDAAEEKINRYDEQDKVSVSGETAGLLSNQANLPYKGRDYDRVMLNAYKALDYLQLGEPDKARVEFMRASQRQQDAEENNKRRIEKAEQADEKLKDAKDEQGKPVKGAEQGKELADKANADPKFKQQVASEYGYLDGFKAKANYANPFVYYINGLYFLTANKDHSDLERARDAFRFTLGSIGDNKFIKQDLEMVDQVLQGGAIPPTTYIIFETGCAPMRDQIRIPIPLFLAGVQNVPYVGATFPTLKKQDGQLPVINIAAAGTSENTLLLASMDSAVGQDFKNELPIIITKTIISAGIKAAASYGVNKAMEKENVWAKLAVKVAMTLAQLAVDIADTRTWNTLPKEFQFCRIPTPADQKIVISGPGGFPKKEVTVEAGSVNLIYVKSISAGSPLIVFQTRLNGSPAPIKATETMASPTPNIEKDSSAVPAENASSAATSQKTPMPASSELPATDTSNKSIATK